MPSKQRLVVAIIVNDAKVISYATNEHECKRIGYPTGIGYELCEGCDYPRHAEAKALELATSGELYLFGHTYACDPCKEKAKAKGIVIHISPLAS